MTKEEAIIIINEVFTQVKETDDEILDITNNLNIILINLQIENAHIKQNTGIEPIAKDLERNINKIKSSVTQLVKDNRNRLNEALEVLKNE
jgi:hypothetical protein